MKLLQFYRTTVGKKLVMGATGLVLFGFLVGHMVGNLKVFLGIEATTGDHKIDIYGAFLREMGVPLLNHGDLLWMVRIVLLGCLFLHILSAFQLTRLRRVSRPTGYAKTTYVATDTAARTMWFGGVIILFYVVYHILHMTTGHFHFQGFEHGEVYQNLVSSFRVGYVVAIYAVAVLAVSFHLYHGVWSAFQTLGWAEGSRGKCLEKLSRVIAIALFVGYISVPAAIFFGFLPDSVAAVLVKGFHP